MRGSPAQEWYFKHKALQEKGLENELDIAEIKAALKGTKNKWYKRVQLYPSRFKTLKDGGDYSWSELINDEPIRTDVAISTIDQPTVPSGSERLLDDESRSRFQTKSVGSSNQRQIPDF